LKLLLNFHPFDWRVVREKNSSAILMLDSKPLKYYFDITSVIFVLNIFDITSVVFFFISPVIRGDFANFIERNRSDSLVKKNITLLKENP